MAQPATTSPKPVAGTGAKDAIDHLRSSAQELHKAISDAAAKRSGATKADIAALTEKAKTVAQSAKASINAEQGKVAKQLTDAVSHLEATQAKFPKRESDGHRVRYRGQEGSRRGACFGAEDQRGCRRKALRRGRKYQITETIMRNFVAIVFGRLSQGL
jgi:hypothetical protein